MRHQPSDDHVLTATLLALALQASPAPCEGAWRRVQTDWDTTAGHAAVADSLRRAARRDSKDGERWLDYGAFLVFTSSEEQSDWRDRVEAEKALDRALRLLDHDPSPMALFSVLRRKQGSRIDAKRLMDRAFGMERDAEIPLGDCLRAELHYQLALIHRTWWEDWEQMHWMPPTAPAIGRCSAIEGAPDPQLAAEAGVVCAAEFHERMSYAQDLSNMRHDDRDAMIAALEAALDRWPAHTDARRQLLLVYYELGDWYRFDRTVEDGLAAGSDPWVRLWAASGAYWRARFDDARRYLTEALPDLAPAERAALLEPARIMAPEDSAAWTAYAPGIKERRDSIFWHASDPLFLTEENERLLAHVARATYAATKFDVPTLDRVGLDTDAGTILLRYGQPLRRWTFRSSRSINGYDVPGRRTTYWIYDSVSPPFVFERNVTYRRWRFSELTQDAFERNVERVPQHWDPTEAFEVWDSLPVLIARFEDGPTQVYDVYGYWTNPDPSLERDSVEAGFFVFDAAMGSLVQERRFRTAETERLRLRFRIPLMPNAYRYSIETLAQPGRAVRRARGLLQVTALHSATPRLSDLLLGRGVGHHPSAIRHRDDLRLSPLYDHVLEPGDSLAVYWETYGLRLDTADNVRYRVTLSVEDSTRSGIAGLVGRLGAALGLGARSGVSLTWDVEVPNSDGIRRDVIVLDPPAWDPGSYVVRIAVQDLVSGGVARVERSVRVPSAARRE